MKFNEYLEAAKEVKEINLIDIAEQIYDAANSIYHKDYEQYVDEMLEEIKQEIKTIAGKQDRSARGY